MKTRMSMKILTVAVLVIAIVAAAAWYKFYRDVAQPEWVRSNQQNSFLYGSVGVEETAGMPYWVWLSLPRMFPEYLPGPGGYASLGFSWEEGREMPVGFSKKTVGYVRVAGNCALCHAISYRKQAQDMPITAAFRRGSNENTERLLTFFAQCAKDPRFNAGDILAEIAMATKLSLVDRLLYRFVIIPRTRQALIDKHLMIDAGMHQHSEKPHSGASFSQLSAKQEESWLKQLKTPGYPLAIDAELASTGKLIFTQHCLSCHAAGDLDGVWLRGPFLHGGSVPTVRDLLLAVEQRPKRFYPGNNLIDPKNLGFVSTEAYDLGRRFLPREVETSASTGHSYGTNLSASDQDALLEYLKTL